MTAELIHDAFALPQDVEDARLASLRQLQMLHTPPDETFARITRMARVVLEVPMAAISLIDAEHQWFKQVDGLDIGATVPRSQTVCRAVIARTYTNPERPELIFRDLRDAPEFASLPGVIEGGIRFYAGLPLYGPGGHAVGTFCVYDTVPRVLSVAQLAALSELAEWAQHELHQVDEMERAALVQRQLLPSRIGDLPGYTVRTSACPPSPSAATSTTTIRFDAVSRSPSPTSWARASAPRSSPRRCAAHCAPPPARSTRPGRTPTRPPR